MATWPFMTFTAKEIKPRPDVRPTHTSKGIWYPPRGTGENVVVLAGATNQRFFCDGQTMRRLAPNQTVRGWPFQVLSIYQEQSNFWVCEGDATSNRERLEWHKMGFIYPPYQDVSFATFRGDRNRLRTQDGSQVWARRLLTHSQQAENILPGDEYQRGGMNGLLSLLLGLIAHAHAREHVIWAFETAFRGGEWSLADTQTSWIDKRGIVVTVYSVEDPRTGKARSTTETLTAFENGSNGIIFD